MSIVEERVKHWVTVLAGAGAERWNVQEVLAQLGPVEESLPEAVVDARVQKLLLTGIKAKLDANPSWNQQFDAVPPWKILHQLLTAARLKELMSVKIIKRGRSNGLGYNVTELAAAFYGRQVLDGLGISKRRVILDKGEYDRLKLEFIRIKLTLPEAVDPTFTERFFAGEDP